MFNGPNCRPAGTVVMALACRASGQGFEAQLRHLLFFENKIAVKLTAIYTVKFTALLFTWKTKIAVK